MYFYVKHVEEGLLRGGISLLLFSLLSITFSLALEIQASELY